MTTEAATARARSGCVRVRLRGARSAETARMMHPSSGIQIIYGDILDDEETQSHRTGSRSVRRQLPGLPLAQVCPGYLPGTTLIACRPVTRSLGGASRPGTPAVRITRDNESPPSAGSSGDQPRKRCWLSLRFRRWSIQHLRRTVTVDHSDWRRIGLLGRLRHRFSVGCSQFKSDALLVLLAADGDDCTRAPQGPARTDGATLVCVSDLLDTRAVSNEFHCRFPLARQTCLVLTHGFIST